MSLGINDTVGEAIGGDTPHTQKFCRGEAFVPGFMNQSRIYLHECFALAATEEGEAFGYKNLGQATKLIARMLRPYKPIVQVEGHIPHEFANNIINSQTDEWIVERFELTQSLHSCYSLLYILQSISKLQPAQIRISCKSG